MEKDDRQSGKGVRLRPAPFFRGKEKEREMKRRITALSLAVLLVAACTLSRPCTLPARASAAVLDAQTTAEIAMLLYSLAESAMIASGVKDGLDDYASGASVTEALGSFLTSLVQPDLSFWEGTQYRLSDGSEIRCTPGSGWTLTSRDGTVYTMDSMPGLDGTGALKLPDEETWNSFRVVDGGGSGPDSGGNGPWERIEAVKLGTGFLAMLGDFASSMFSREVPGVDIYGIMGMEGEVYTGTVPRDERGLYMYRGTVGPSRTDGLGAWYLHRDDTRVMVAYINSLGYISFGYPDSGGSGIYSSGNILRRYPGGPEAVSGVHMSDGIWHHFNFPFFATEAQALAYLQTGSPEGLLNGLALDYPGLAGSVPETLAPLAGTSLRPDRLPAVNHALSGAAQALPEPLPESDPAENTDNYRQAISDVIREEVPAPLPDPDPVPDPEPDPAPEPGDSIGDYKRDLTMIFPFCLPFDFIRFLSVLDAEPEAPCFEFPVVVPALGLDMVAVLDLSFMEPVMAIFRTGELGLFVAMLIGATSRLIRW